MVGEMQKKEQSHKQNHDVSTEHRICERRVKKDSPGFTYITTVGWICRRENYRRKGNDFLFKKRL